MHTSFMLAALEQAHQGRGFCAPNPAVGAVLVHDDQIVAKAWHPGAGKAHAEQLLLEQLSHQAKSMVLYVTLEPCNHWGKTPPCVLAIIASGISRVVYGFADPNPLVANNNTPKILQAEGIEVIHWPLPEVEAFYASYAYWIHTKKPWVTAKIAQSLDGKIADEASRPVALSNAACKQFTHKQRLASDLILTTAKTILNDDPALNVRLDAQNPLAKPIAILDRQLSLNKEAQIFKTASHCYIYYDEKILIKDRIENCSYYPLSTHKGHLDLQALIEHLGALGFHDVWVEAGGALFSALHQAQLVQTSYVYLTPNVLGPGAVSAYQGEQFFNRPYTISWQVERDNVIACVQWGKSCLPV